MAETRLPATDPVRFDPSPIAEAICEVHVERLRNGWPQQVSRELRVGLTA